MSEASLYANGGIIAAMLGTFMVFLDEIVNLDFAAEGTALILFGIAMLLAGILSFISEEKD